MRRLLTAGALVMMGWASSASAQLAIGARFHDREAAAHARAGRWEDAARDYLAAQRHVPSLARLARVADCLEHAGRLVEAYSFHAEVAAEPEASPELRAGAEAAMERLASSVARVRVESEPVGAEIFVDDSLQGSLGATPRRFAVEAGPHRVFVRLARHHPFEASIVARVGQESVVDASLRPLQGRLSVTSVPDVAIEVLREGEPVVEGRTPYQASLPAGDYTLVARAEGYASTERRVEVRTDELTPVELQLTPRASPGRIIVATEGDTLELWVDGQDTGAAPLVLDEVTAGPHDLRLTRDGDTRWSGRVELAPTEDLWLTTAAPPTAGSSRSELTWIFGGAGLGVLIAGAIVAGFATDTRAQFDERTTAGDAIAAASLRERGLALNITADALLAAGGVALAAGVVLFFATESSDSGSMRVEVEARPR